MAERPALTDLLRRAQNGDSNALRDFFEIAYQDLCQMAHARLRKTDRGAVLDTASLVHESYLRFAKASELRIEDRLHFFRYAGRVMRSVIVDLARARLAARRGGGEEDVRLDTSIAESLPSGGEEVLRVHEALDELSGYGERIVQVVEMRYFGGLTEPEIAEALGVTDRTVRRDWEKARLLLARALV